MSGTRRARPTLAPRLGRCRRLAPDRRSQRELGSREQKARGILRNTLEAHFEMQVRPGRPAGIAGGADQLAALDDLAGLDVDF